MHILWLVNVTSRNLLIEILANECKDFCTSVYCNIASNSQKKSIFDVHCRGIVKYIIGYWHDQI